MAGYIGSQTPVVSNGSQRKYTFTATAAQTVFTGMDIPNPQQIQVFQNGVRLVITTDYTVSSGTTVTLVNAASAGDSLVVILFADYQLLDTDALTFTGGTTIEGDLTVDTNTLYVDSTNNRVGVGVSSPSYPMTIASASNAVGLAINGRSADGLGAAYWFANNGTTQHGDIRASASEFRISSTPASAVQTFYTNGSERLRILSSGGITFNGDTAAANALDDYEEGLYDVTFSGDSGTPFTKTSAGKYLKIGRLVFINFYAYAGSSPTVPSGSCYASLPFTADTSPLLYSHIMQGYAGGLSLNTVPNVSNGRRWQINNSSQLTSYTGNWASSPSYYELSGAGCYIAAS